MKLATATNGRAARPLAGPAAREDRISALGSPTAENLPRLADRRRCPDTRLRSWAGNPFRAANLLRRRLLGRTTARIACARLRWSSRRPVPICLVRRSQSGWSPPLGPRVRRAPTPSAPTIPDDAAAHSCGGRGAGFRRSSRPNAARVCDATWETASHAKNHRLRTP